MTLFDWLGTPAGLAFVNAATLLVTSVAAWFAVKAKQQSSANADMLNGHLRRHVEEAVSSSSAEDPHNP